MRPEAALHMAKSRELLDTARSLLRDHYANDAVEKAGRFVERIASVLEKPDHEAPAQTAAPKRKE